MGNTSKHKNNSINKNKSYQNFFKEYCLIKENKKYKIVISKNEEKIIIKMQNYEKKMNNNELSLLLKTKLNTINDAYFFIINKFDEDRVTIKEILEKNSLKLLFKISIDDNKENQIEIILIYNKGKINNEKKYTKNKNNNAKDIRFSIEISKESYSHWDLDNSFTVFRSLDDILYLIYCNNKNSLIGYDKINNKKIIEIKYAHEHEITNIRYYLDNIYKRDLIMSISGQSNYLKIWNIYNFELILTIENIYFDNGISSACFLNDFKLNYILTSASYNNKESIKKFDFNGNEIGEIKDSKDQIFFIDIYYQFKLNKIYILTANYRYIKVYDYNKNKLKNIYCDNSNAYHNSIIIQDNSDSIIKLIESSDDGNIRIWDFNSGKLLNKIKISNLEL